MLTDKPLHDLIAAFAAPDPTPGGGSGAAVASAIGAALLVMVSNLPKTRGNTDEERSALTRVTPTLESAARELTAAVDADSAAYDAVVAAYRLPKGSEQEKAARKEAVQRAMRQATEVPLQVMRLSARAIEAAKAVAAHAHRPAASDAGVGIGLLLAGLDGARLNVDTNLDSVADASYRDQATADADRMKREAEANADAARALLR